VQILLVRSVEGDLNFMLFHYSGSLYQTGGLRLEQST
jgi:hypothetical protein